jgi:acetoin utilization protein AcuB
MQRMKVRDAMSTRTLLTVTENDSIALAGQLMLWSGVRHVPVVRGRTVVGVLSDRDLARPSVDGRMTAGETMSAPAITVPPDEELAEAATTLARRRIGCLPVVEAGELVGMLTITDVLVVKIARMLEQEARPDVTVAEAMTRDPCTVRPETSLVDAVAAMVSCGARHLPVVRADGRVVGMVSERDLRSAVGNPLRAAGERAERVKLEAIPVSSVMSRPPVTLDEHESLATAAERLVDHRIGAIPITSDGRLVGVVSYVDVIRELLRHPVRVEVEGEVSVPV